MTAMLRIDNRDVVSLRDGRWGSTDGRWVALLESLDPPGGVSPTAGNPERWLAERAAAWLKARGVAAEVLGVSAEPEREEAVY